MGGRGEMGGSVGVGGGKEGGGGKGLTKGVADATSCGAVTKENQRRSPGGGGIQT
jgi:hypothetical protein